MAVSEDGDDAAMRARLTTLSGALEAHRKPAAAAKEDGTSSPKGIGEAVNLGFRVMSEFVASVAVGGAIGWSIDHWLGSSPAALIVFIGLGTAAGFWSIYRLAMRSSAPRAR